MNRRENLNFIYILLFLNVAFYLLQVSDPQRYVNLFAFEFGRFFHAHQYWRLFTYQFVQGGMLSLFFNLLILYIMGGAVEEELGTWNFLALLLLSTIGSAAVATVLGIPLLGSFFASFSLLFIFATMVPEQVFYLFFILPVKVKWLAWLGLAWLGWMVLRLDPSGLAIAGGSALSYAWYYVRFRGVARLARPRPSIPKSGYKTTEGTDAPVQRNRDWFARIESVLQGGGPDGEAALIAEIEPKIVPDVNICPPVDYKPQAEDGYCLRCEGFAECSVRYLRMSSSGDSSDEKAALRD